MSIGPITPATIAGGTNTPAGKAVEAALPTAASGDSTDRDGDGRQVLDVFERTESKEEEPEVAPDPTDVEPSSDSDGGLNFLA